MNLEGGSKHSKVVYGRKGKMLTLSFDTHILYNFKNHYEKRKKK